MRINYNITGLSELHQNMERSKWDIIGATKKGMLLAAQEIMAESLKEVPRMTNTLADSAFVEQDAKGNVDFGYGGTHAKINPLTGLSANDYMVAVHERLDVFHPTGKAKFLEDPVNRYKAKGEGNLINKIKAFLHI
jgi:hypothetical protein